MGNGTIKQAAISAALGGSLTELREVLRRSNTLNRIIKSLENPTTRAVYGGLLGGGAGLSHGVSSDDEPSRILAKVIGGAGAGAALTGLANKRYAMLASKGLPLFLGAGALGTGVYLGNKLGGGNSDIRYPAIPHSIGTPSQFTI